MENINPVKYASFAGGLRPPTAANLLLPASSALLDNFMSKRGKYLIGSAALFNGVKIKLILMAVFSFCVPAMASASQLFPPEIPVLFYGGAKINNNPAPVSAVISIIAKDSNWEIASSTIKNIGEYFIEIPCKNYVGEDIVFNLDNFASGQNKCPDVMVIPSVNFDLSVEYKQEDQEEPKEQEEYKNIGSSIIFPPTPCVKAVYDAWQETCVNNRQYRNVISKMPNNCAMTEEQKAETKRECGLDGVGEGVKVLGAEFYPDNSLIRGSDMKIYLIENQTKRHITSIKALEKFIGREIFNVADEIINLYPAGEKIFADYKNGDLIRGSDMKVYIIKNNKKHHIINLKELQKYAGQKIYDVSGYALDMY